MVSNTKLKQLYRPDKIHFFSGAVPVETTEEGFLSLRVTGKVYKYTSSPILITP